MSQTQSLQGKTECPEQCHSQSVHLPSDSEGSWLANPWHFSQSADSSGFAFLVIWPRPLLLLCTCLSQAALSSLLPFQEKSEFVYNIKGIPGLFFVRFHASSPEAASLIILIFL